MPVGIHSANPLRLSKKLLEKIQRAINSGVYPMLRRTSAARGSHPRALACIIASNEYGSYCVPRSSLHRPTAQAILRGKVWEPETIDFMRASCGTGDIVHAGTYFGDFLPALAGALRRDAKIWAFEPNRENYRCTRITIELNDIARQVALTHAALGSEAGRIRLRTTDDAGHPLGGASHVTDTGGEAVAQVALDDSSLAQRSISILQLDVEGCEETVLRGAQRIIRRDQPILILETAPRSAWFNSLLDESGYTLRHSLAGNSIFVAADRRPV